MKRFKKIILFTICLIGIVYVFNPITTCFLLLSGLDLEIREKIRQLIVRFKKYVIGTLVVSGVAVIIAVISSPFGAFAGAAILYSVLNFTHDTSLDPKYAEIYDQTFEMQKDLFLCQWEDSKGIFLCDDTNTICAKSIGQVAKGNLLRVKKITTQNKWAGKSVKILVEIDNPKFSVYKAINAQELTTDSNWYDTEKTEFNPRFLRNINIQTLRQAVQYEDIAAVKRLIESGADLNEESYGETPFFLTRNTEIAELLIEKGANINQGRSLLHLPEVWENSRYVKFLIEKGANLEQKDKYGDTPLLVATITGYFEDVELLLKLGADPQAKNSAFKTALHLAAIRDNLKIAQLLVDAGAPVNCADQFGMTPLHCADSFQMIKFLIAHGADIQQTDHEGRTVFHEVCRGVDQDAVEFLFEQGAQINLCDKKGLTPFHEAAFYGHFMIIDWLIKHGADVALGSNVSNDPPLHRLADLGRMKQVMMLVLNGANIHQTDDLGRTPLFYACDPALDVNNLNLVNWLIGRGSDVNHQDNEGRTPLHLACSAGNDQIVLLLLEKGADVNIKDNNGMTPK